MDILKIDLMVPIYYKTELRKKLTLLQLKYIKYLNNELKKNNILLSLTIIGESNYKIEIEKYLKFNKENIYINFNQEEYKINYKKNFFRNYRFKNMLHNKIKLGLKYSFQKNFDISFFMGSNDFMCIDFFLQLKKSFKRNKKQVYGIHKSNNELNNASFFYEIKNNIEFKEINYWDGNYSKEMYNSGNFYYFGCLIGFNKLLYSHVLSMKTLYHEINIENV